MVKTTIKIHVSSGKDEYARWVGANLDGKLPRDFWETGEHRLGVVSNEDTFTFEKNIRPGIHTLTVGVASGSEDNARNVAVTVNDKELVSKKSWLNKFVVTPFALGFFIPAVVGMPGLVTGMLRGGASGKVSIENAEDLRIPKGEAPEEEEEETEEEEE